MLKMTLCNKTHRYLTRTEDGEDPKNSSDWDL